jgi:hypothetical protein
MLQDSLPENLVPFLFGLPLCLERLCCLHRLLFGDTMQSLRGKAALA